MSVVIVFVAMAILFAYAKEQGHADFTTMYLWYITCPKCAKKYGTNYVVMVGRVAFISKKHVLFMIEFFRLVR